MSRQTAFEVGRLYGPLKAIADTLTAAQKDVFIQLPALVAYYPMGIRSMAADVIDHSAGQNDLTQVGVCPVGYDGNAFSHLGNGTNYFALSSALAVTGLETWVSSSLRGLTVGGWFMIDSTPSGLGGMVTKFGASGNRGYSLEYLSSNLARFILSSNGTAVFQADSPVLTISQWRFFVGRFIPSTEIAVFADGDKSVTTVAVPASINVSTQAFELGRRSGSDSDVVHAKARDVFVCASALSDAVIEELRVSSAP